MKRTGLLLALTVCLALSPAPARGDVEIRQFLPLTPSEQTELRGLTRVDRSARARWTELKHEADAVLGRTPRPLAAIHYQGLLDSDPRRVSTQASLVDMDRLAILGYAYAASGAADYREHARRYILAWVRAYRPTGDPINENKLEPVWLSYGMLRAHFTPAERAEVESWMAGLARGIITAGPRSWEPGKPKTNWDAKRAKIVGGIGFVLRDQKLVDRGLQAFRLCVADGLFPDGSSVDLRERDALSYHNSHVETLLVLAILAEQHGERGLYDYRAPSGSSVRNSAIFVVPFAKGERTRGEWLNTTVELDRQRAAAGLAHYQPGKRFEPEQAIDVMERAAYFEPAYLPLVRKLHKAGSARFPSWAALIADVLRRGLADAEWPRYGRDPGGARYSPLSQIHGGNVARLQRAWTFRTGDLELRGKGDYQTEGRGPAFEATPLVVDGVLYLSTPSSRVIALDPETGRELWKFDPFAGREADREFRAHRGVAFWQGTAADGRTPLKRILYGTSDGRLIGLDAATGQRAGGFGSNGEVNLRDPRWPDERYGVTSPPAIFRDLVIVGAEVPEASPRGPSGEVRAFDVRSGRLAWRFHTIPRPGEPGHDTWAGDSWRDRTGANVWSIMSVDTALGLVFLPTGSASYDFYGGDRPGKNLYANSLVALDAGTGRLRWFQQLVHHDIWDYDVPAQPVLVTLRRGGRAIPAVVQVSKMGWVFVFDRRTGEPLFPIEERPVSASKVPGEATWPTQPFPLKPAPLVRQHAVGRDEISRVTPESHAQCLALFNQARSGGLYTPPGDSLAIIFPGTLGGATWSGASWDSTTGLLYINVNEIGSLIQMRPQPEGAPTRYRRGGPGGEYGRFWDDQRLPCQQPPWGKLVAVDLGTGEIVWSVPLGVVDALLERGVPPTGAPNLGGTIATAGGLVFVAGTNDRRFRAFDARTGEELWTARLEASGHATPITYLGRRTGRQFVVIAAGGGGPFSQDFGDALVAFALPGS